MERLWIKELKNKVGEKVLIKGWIYRLRRLSKITFIIMRDRTGYIQVVFDNDRIKQEDLRVETALEISGLLTEGNNKYASYEIQGESLKVLSAVMTELPLEVNSEVQEANLETQLNHRVLSLRHRAINPIFKVQALLAQGFSEFLRIEGFTEVFSPKIVGGGAEGGTAIFQVKYFEKEAYLAQSPQFYKQMLVASGYERVFEIGAVYRAEEHNTSRHLNEYISLDLEMGFIEDEEELMELEGKLLKFLLEKLKREGEEYLKELKVELPSLSLPIPRLSLQKAIEILKEKYNKECKGDLDPEGEKLICSYGKEVLGSEFLFLTDYPQEKRPMYTMPKEGGATHSFDLLFRGLEITTGGQRIHSYDLLIENIIKKGLKPQDFQEYTEVFKYGVPPHGGLAIGLERLTAQLLGLKNVREASLFPRDRTRITP